MEKIFQDAKDKYVTAIVVYGNISDSKLYVDAEHTEQVKQEVIEDAFAKNALLIKISTASYRPVKVSGNKVTVVDFSGGTVTATEFSAKASE